MSDTPRSDDNREPGDDWVDDGEEWDDDVAPAAPRRRPAPRSAERDDDYDWDDDDGDWDRRPHGPGGVSPTVLVGALVAIVALIVVIVLVRGGSDGDDEVVTGGNGDTTAATEPGADEVPMCANWPGVGGLGAPEVVSEPGVHMWSDLDGWHLSRVPGDGVPAVSATVANDSTADDPPTAKDATGGATVAVEGTGLVVTLPAGDAASQGNFDIGKYAKNVTITMRDDAGELLDPATYTTGGGDKSSLNPIVATQEMQPCDG